MKKALIFHFFFLLATLGMLLLYMRLGSPGANIMWQVRLPRLVLTVFTGMALAGIGSIYQLLLANPLAEPYILGISSGSAFGSILLGVMGMVALMPLGGFLGAGVTLLVVWTLAQKNGSFDRSRLLIAGVIAGMFFASAISLLMYLYRQDTMLILGVLMGNLGRIFSHTEWQVFVVLTLISTALMGYLYFRSRSLDIMSGGELYAGSVGIDVSRLRLEIFVISSIIIGISVSYAGIIGFIGLIIPHFIRFFIPSGQRKIYLYSMWAGAIFLLAADLIAKNIAAVELPVGVITAAVGCPFFIWQMRRSS